MTPELQKYYEDRFAMMATPGWRDLCCGQSPDSVLDAPSTAEVHRMLSNAMVLSLWPGAEQQ